MMYNLNRDLPAYDLANNMGPTAKAIIPGEGKVLRPWFLPESFDLRTSATEPPTKVYRATLEEKRNGTFVCQTRPDWGGELYYAPMSVLVLFQHLVNTLDELYLAWTASAIMGMVLHYRTGGTWNRLPDLIVAPDRGFAIGAEYLAENGYIETLNQLSGGQ
jgi:hypothetical protein